MRVFSFCVETMGESSAAKLAVVAAGRVYLGKSTAVSPARLPTFPTRGNPCHTTKKAPEAFDERETRFELATPTCVVSPS